jgi:hypothetical protein
MSSDPNSNLNPNQNLQSHSNKRRLLRNEVLNAFGIKDVNKMEWRIPCPGHKGKDLNLVVTDKNGKFLLHCHSRSCSPESICASVGIELKDLFYSDGFENQNSIPEFVATNTFDTWQQIIPAPEDIPESLLLHKDGCKADHAYKYRDVNGKIVCVVARWDQSAEIPKKQFIQFTYWKNNATGNSEWRPKGLIGALKPLYNLDLIAKNPDAEIVICEGEKCADVGNNLNLSGIIFTTFLGGTGGATKADYSVLKDRIV